MFRGTQCGYKMILRVYKNGTLTAFHELWFPLEKQKHFPWHPAASHPEVCKMAHAAQPGCLSELLMPATLEHTPERSI